MSKMGRPSKRTPEIVDAVLAGLAKGTPLTVICREVGVCDDTVRDWAAQDEQLARDIARAREAGFDALALEALSIADDGQRDYVPNEDGNAVVNHDHIQRSKLRVDTRLKLLAKWDPKRYGEQQRLLHANDPESPITGASDAELDAKIEALLAKRSATGA